MIQDAIRSVVERRNLTAHAAHGVMLEMMRGDATPSQIASFITAMRMKGETEDELLGFVTAMRERSASLSAPDGSVDLCGTGGDGSRSFNISTCASIVAAAAGVPVAKHGNSSVSSMSGSADVLAALGVPIDLPPAMVQECLRSSGLGFMFAPVFHESMRNVSGPRKELGLRTFFNILGPMTNPAGVKRQLIGVYDPGLAPLMASVLARLGTSRAMIVNGSGMDEMTTTGTTHVVELLEGHSFSYQLEPGMFGLDAAQPGDLAGGGPQDNARILLSIMKGVPGPCSDVVALNAGAAIYLSGRAGSVYEGLEMAQEAIESGKAMDRLRAFAGVSRELESRRQLELGPRVLLKRRIMPEVLKARAKDLTEELLRRVEDAGGTEMLSNIDPDLISEPNILSILVLNRARSMLEGPDKIPDGRARRSHTSMSRSIQSREGISIIAEYKPFSPGASPLSIPPDPGLAIRAFKDSGVAGVSVLVEPDFFSGGHALFSRFRSIIDEPMLFKDFVVSERQVDGAAHAGADAILLIAKALTDRSLDGLVRSSLGQGLEPLVEVHDELDMSKLCSCPSIDRVRLVGLNSRDLRTLTTDISSLGRLRSMVPEGKVCIAESGIQQPEDLRSLRGFDAALVGSALMRSDDVARELASLVSTGVRV